jgi:hypothetical protein
LLDVASVLLVVPGSACPPELQSWFLPVISCVVVADEPPPELSPVEPEPFAPPDVPLSLPPFVLDDEEPEAPPALLPEPLEELEDCANDVVATQSASVAAARDLKNMGLPFS